jgi:probable phosphoglycerate mutase
MTIYYVRHGETAWNRALKFQGQGDSPLTLHGVRLAMAYAEHLRSALRDTASVRVYTSPLGRARQTATLIADALDVDLGTIEADHLLAEQHVGVLGGLTWDEVRERHGITPEVFHGFDFRPPGGESKADLLARARAWLAKDHPKPCIVVSHGGMSRLFRGACLGLTPDAIAELPSHTHGRYFELGAGGVKMIEVSA